MHKSDTKGDNEFYGLNVGGLIAGVSAMVLGIIVAICFVSLGLVAPLGDATFIAIMALPLVTYALVTHAKSISKVSAGGIEIELKNFADSNVDVVFTSSSVDKDVNSIELINKSTIDALLMRRGDLSPTAKIALTMELGTRQQYRETAVLFYLNVLLSHDADLSVIFVDNRKKFVASTLGVKLRDALVIERDKRLVIEENKKNPENSVFEFYGPQQSTSPFISAVENSSAGNLSELKKIVAITEVSVKPNTSNSQALELMLSEDTSKLVAVCDNGEPSGLVQRDVIVARMLTTFATEKI